MGQSTSFLNGAITRISRIISYNSRYPSRWPFIGVMTINYNPHLKTSRGGRCPHLVSLKTIFLPDLMKLRYVDFDENVTKEACDEAWSWNGWWFRNPSNHHKQNPVNNGINYQPQLLSRISSNRICVILDIFRHEISKLIVVDPIGST